jgi:hypothetical protein
MDRASDLIGRRGELDVLAELIDQGATCGPVLVVRGDPASASPRCWTRDGLPGLRGSRVLPTVGVQSEAQLPYAGPAAAASGAVRWRDLPPAQRDALLSAFGLFDGPRPEPFLIALSAADLLVSVAADRRRSCSPTTCTGSTRSPRRR